MQTKLSSRCIVYLVAMLTLVGTFAMLGCSSDDDDDLRSVPGIVVDLNSPERAAAALENTTFTFSDGVPLFGTTRALTSVAFNDTAIGAVIAAGAAGATSAAAGVEYLASCRFTVGISNFPPASPLARGNEVLIPQCQFEVTAEDVPVGGGPVDGVAFLRLGPPGTTTSAAVGVQVALDEDGTLIINGFDTGIFITGTEGE